MRSGKNCIINSGQVHSWSLGLLLDAKLVKDHGWKCSAEIVLGITLRAAARCISINAACRDLAKAPSDQAVLTALDEGLPKKLLVLERRLNDALIAPLPRRMRRRAWNVAIDWHLQPYYGEPFQSRNELYYGKPKQGTANFHAYRCALAIADIATARTASSGIRSCCSRRGAYMVLRPKSANCIACDSASRRVIARCGRRESTPARGILGCGCSFWP